MDPRGREGKKSMIGLGEKLNCGAGPYGELGN